MSSENPNEQTNEALKTVLGLLEGLDLTGQLNNISPVVATAGSYSNIFRAQYRKPDNTEMHVALKRIRVSLKSDLSLAKAFAKELYVWSKLNHENVVKLEGYFLEENDYPSIVSEWAEGGTVTEYVKRHSECDLVNIALGIAKGLEYLHSCNIIHADLKGSNVLMNASGTPMLADFGQSRALNYTQAVLVTTSHDTLKGSAHWIAYELLDFLDKDDAEVACTKESDLWSYGMVIYEIISQKIPYEHIKGPFSEFKIMRAIRRKELPEKPLMVDTNSKELLWGICEECWKFDPKERIQAKQIVQRIMPGECTIGRTTYLQWLTNILYRTKDWFFRDALSSLSFFRFFGRRG